MRQDEAEICNTGNAWISSSSSSTKNNDDNERILMKRIRIIYDMDSNTSKNKSFSLKTQRQRHPAHVNCRVRVRVSILSYKRLKVGKYRASLAKLAITKPGGRLDPCRHRKGAWDCLRDAHNHHGSRTECNIPLSSTLPLCCCSCG